MCLEGMTDLGLYKARVDAKRDVIVRGDLRGKMS